MAQSPLFGKSFDRQSQYRDRLAAQLLAEGSDSSPIQHPLQGAARLAQALAGGLIGMKQDQRYAEREKQSSEAMAALFAPTQQFVPSAAGAGPRPGAQMQTAQPTFAELARKAASHQATAHLAPQFAMQDMAARQAAEQRGRYVPVMGSDGKTPIGQRNTATDKIEYFPAGMMDQWEEAVGPGGLPGQRNKRTGEWKPADVRPVTNVNTPVNVTGDTGPKIGSIPKDYELVKTPEGRFRFEVIPGSQTARELAEAEEKKTARTGQQRNAGDIVTTDIQRIFDKMDKSVLPTTGLVGNVLANVGGTASNDVRGLLQGIRSEIAFGRLQAMREASPTGGALGAVTAPELELLQNSLGSLEQSQTEAQFRQNLARVEALYNEIIHGKGNGPTPRDAARGVTPGSAGPRGAPPRPQAAQGQQPAQGGGIKFLGFEGE